MIYFVSPPSFCCSEKGNPLMGKVTSRCSYGKRMLKQPGDRPTEVHRATFWGREDGIEIWSVGLHAPFWDKQLERTSPHRAQEPGEGRRARIVEYTRFKVQRTRTRACTQYLGSQARWHRGSPGAGKAANGPVHSAAPLVVAERGSNAGETGSCWFSDETGPAQSTHQCEGLCTQERQCSWACSCKS